MSTVLAKLMAAAVVLGVIGASGAKADVVILTDGGQLNGTVKSAADGKIVLHSDSLGDVTIPQAHVRTFSTDQPILVQMADGTMVSGQVASADAGTIKLAGSGRSVQIADIDAVNPQAFTASATLGAILTRGNTFTDSLNAGFKAGYKVQAEDITFLGEYLYGRQKTRNVTVNPVTQTITTETTTTSTTTDRWELEGKYEHSFSKKFYGYADVDVVKDRIAQLELRVVPSVGIGYKFFNTDKFKLNGEGGVAYLFEEFTNGTRAQKQVALQFGYHLSYDFNPNVNLFNDVTYFPSMQHIENYLIDADLGLHAKLTSKLFAELKVEWNYDSQPAVGALKNDERYVASLGYTL